MTTKKVNELSSIGDIADGDVLVGERVNGTTVRITYAAPTGVSDGDKGDIVVSSSGTVWNIDTPSSATVATNDKVLIKDTDASNALKYVTAQSIADLASASPGGSNTQIQYNNSGSFGGVSQMTYNGSNVSLTTGLTVDGTADEVQLKVQGHSTQTSNVLEVTTSADSDLFTVDNSGNVAVAGTVDGRDVADDGTKLDTIEDNADVTDEANVTSALDGATLTAATVATGDKVLIQDADDADNLKTATAQSIANLVADTTVAGDSGSTAITPGDTLTVAGGTNATTAMSGDTLTVNVDDAFLSNSGDTGTGSYDFGGADDFEIPNGAAPTVDTAGQIAIDTTITDYTGMMKYHDGTEELTVLALPTANLSTTDGDTVVYDAANNELTMSTPSGGGDWVLVASATASNDSSVEFTGLSSTYSAYTIQMWGVAPASDGVSMWFRVSTDNGSSYKSGATDYRYAAVVSGTTNMVPLVDTADSKIACNHTGVTHSNGSNRDSNGFINIHNPSDTSYYCCIDWKFGLITTTGNSAWLSGQGEYTATTAVNAIQILFSSGNISTGEFRLYGLKGS